MEEELERLIRATEIVILPEGSSIDEFLTSPKPGTSRSSTFLSRLSEKINLRSAETNFVHEEYDDDENIEDFDLAYQLSKSRSHIFEVSEDSSQKIVQFYINVFNRFRFQRLKTTHIF